MKNLSTTLVLLLGFLWSHAQSPVCPTVRVESVTALPGEDVCLDVRIEGFPTIIGLQFSLEWDAGLLELREVGNFGLPGLNLSNFNSFPDSLSAGRLAVAWTDPRFSGAGPTGEPIFSVCFRAKGTIGDFASVSFSDTSTPPEFVTSPDGSSQVSGYILLGGAVEITPTDDIPLTLGGICGRLESCAGANSGSLTAAATGGTEPYVWDWRGPDGFESGGADLNGLAPGDYRLTLTDSDNGRLLARAQVGVLALDSLLFQLSHPSCEGADDGTIDLTVPGGPGGYSFAWSTGASTEDAEGLAAGTYTVSVTAPGGCSTVRRFTLIDQADLGFHSVVSHPTCGRPNGAIRLAPPAGELFTYDWSTGADSSAISGLLPGDYSVTITHAAGCRTTLSWQLVDTVFDYDLRAVCPDSAGTAYGLQAIVYGGGIPPYTFGWSNGIVETDSSFSSIEVDPAGLNTVTITDGEGCAVVDSLFAECPQGDNRLSLYLNPVTVASGQPFCLDLRTTGFREVVTLQFSLAWDAAAFRFTGLENSALPRFDTDDYVVQTIEGRQVLSVTWNSDSLPSVTLADHSALFRLCLEPLADEGTFSIEFAAGPAPFEVLNAAGQVLEPNLSPGEVRLLPDYSDAIQLFASNHAVEPGADVCVEITTADFRNVGGLQFSLRWNPALLQFREVRDFTLSETTQNFFGLTEASQGILRFAWADLVTGEGVTLPDSSVLFRLCFTALDSLGLSPIQFSDEPLPFEARSATLERLEGILYDGAVVIGDGFVWPGDTDRDELVTHFDLLPVGLAYDAQGPARAGATLRWMPQPAVDWGQRTPQSGLDFKTVDTDGDGIIGAADTVALLRNWGRRAGQPEPRLPVVVRNEGALLYVAPHEVAPGEAAAFSIVLGEAENPATDVYGLAFTILYDTSLVKAGAAQARIVNSWLGTPGTDLIAVQRDDRANGRLDIAMTRIDQTNRSGFGAIASLRVTIEDVILIRSGEQRELPFQIEAVRLIDAAETAKSVSTPETSAPITGTSSVVPSALAPRVALFPVPAREKAFLLAPDLHIRSVECFDVNGRLTARFGPVTELDVRTWQPGVYTLRIVTDEGVVIKRLVR